MTVAVIFYLATCPHQGKKRPGFHLSLKSFMSESIYYGTRCVTVKYSAPLLLKIYHCRVKHTRYWKEQKQEKIIWVGQWEEHPTGRGESCTQVPAIKRILYIFHRYSTKLGQNKAVILEGLPSPVECGANLHGLAPPQTHHPAQSLLKPLLPNTKI